jgi:hypothetical protein
VLRACCFEGNKTFSSTPFFIRAALKRSPDKMAVLAGNE